MTYPDSCYTNLVLWKLSYRNWYEWALVLPTLVSQQWSVQAPSPCVFPISSLVPSHHSLSAAAPGSGPLVTLSGIRVVGYNHHWCWSAQQPLHVLSGSQLWAVGGCHQYVAHGSECCGTPHLLWQAASIPLVPACLSVVRGHMCRMQRGYHGHTASTASLEGKGNKHTHWWMQWIKMLLRTYCFNCYHK